MTRRKVRYHKVMDGMDLWYDLDLAIRQGRKYVVVPVGTMRELLTKSGWPRGATANVPFFDADNPIEDNV